MPDLPVLADAVADVDVSAPQLLADSFRRYERYAVELKSAEGAPLKQRREVLRIGGVVALLAIDPGRDEIVLIRQFRLAAHLATGKGELVEIVAGHIEAGENPAAAARRECQEEIGVAPQALYELFSFMPAPGMVAEYATLYLAVVDAARVPDEAGAADEAERTRPMRVGIDAALAALERNEMHNGFLILALQWLGLHRRGLDEFLRTRTPAPA
jgi:ADP-ribose pyrophosphatase